MRNYINDLHDIQVDASTDGRIIVKSDDVDDVDHVHDASKTKRITPDNTSLSWAIATEDGNPNQENFEQDVSSEAGAARAFAAHFKGCLVFCEGSQNWYRKEDQIYSKLSPVAMQGISMNYLVDVAKTVSSEKLSRALRSRAKINGVPHLARSILSRPLEDFDSDMDVIGTEDGKILHLSERKLLTDYDGIVTRRAGTKYDADATCPIWLETISQCLGTNEAVALFQRAVGYSLSGHVSEQCLFLMVGSGANGKTLLSNTISSLVGDYSASTPMQSLMIGREGQTADLAHLVGKRFVIAAEGEENQKLAESKIKLMTGGDLITCRHLYRSFFTYKPQFKLWLATNSLPRISGVDEGIWRRIVLIRFPVTIPVEQRDQQLEKRLQAELPGILNWALDGYAAWRKIGLQVPDQLLADRDLYRLDNDPVQQWIDSRCERKSDAVESAGALFDDYRRWVASSDDGISNVIFGRILRRKGFSNQRRREGNAWRGLKLLPRA